MGKLTRWAKMLADAHEGDTWLRKHELHVARRVHRDTDGHVRSSVGASGGSGGHSDPTATAVLNETPKGSECDPERLLLLASRYRRSQEDLISEMAKGLPAGEMAAQSMVTKEGVVCVNPNCARKRKKGQEEDEEKTIRWIEERCYNCYMTWYRSGRTRERSLADCMKDLLDG